MDRVLIGPIDLLYVPLYCSFLYFIFLQIKKRHSDDELVQKYFIKGFVYKMAGSIFLALLTQYYYGYGDTLSYYRESLIMREAVAQNQTTILEIFTQDYEYFQDKFGWEGSSAKSGFVVAKISFLLTYLSFSRFLLTGCLLTGLCYFGIFKLFRVFVSLAPDKHRFISFIVIFFPSLVVYGSGVFKDPITFSALGWMVYALYEIFHRKKISVKNIIIVILSFLLIINIKSYIIAAFMVPLSISIVMGLTKNIKSVALKFVALPVFVIILVSSYLALSSSIDEMLGAFAFEKLTESIQGQQLGYARLADDAGSNFEIGEMEPTLGGVTKKMPVGITAALFRPFLWEVRKPIMLFTALESLFILWYTLQTIFRVGIFSFFKYIFSDTGIFFCVMFALLFSALVGLSTPNFGTLARYRIPVIPFYLFGMLLIQQRGLLRKKQSAVLKGTHLSVN